MAYKVFTNGSVLNASEVNDNLMNQAVITFTNSTARASAITSPVEGMVTYLADTDTYQFWNGSAWTNLVSSSVGSGNAIINGGMDIWQRGTSFSGASVNIYTADRWQAGMYGGASFVSRQASGFTGIEYSLRHGRNSGNATSSTHVLVQNMETEDSIPYAGKQIAFSFYAKAGANFSSASSALRARVFSGTGIDQNNLTVGFTGAVTLIDNSVTLTTSWQRFTATATVGTTATQLALAFEYISTGTAGANDWFEITGVQLEAGSTATAFRRNANSIQGELDACQRYYTRFNSTSAFGPVTGTGQAESTTRVRIGQGMPTTMRNLSSISWGNIRISDGINSFVPSSVFLSGDNGQVPQVVADATGMTAFRPYWLQGNNNTAGFLAIEGEL